jgi:hypothetical protein
VDHVYGGGAAVGVSISIGLRSGLRLSIFESENESASARKRAFASRPPCFPYFPRQKSARVYAVDNFSEGCNEQAKTSRGCIPVSARYSPAHE